MSGGLDGVADAITEFIETVTGQASRRRRREVLQAVAADYHGHYHPAQSGFFSSRAASVTLVTRDVAVVHDTYVVSTGKSSTTYSRWRAPFLLPRGPAFRVYREHALSSLGKLLGFTDVVLGGDPWFDEHFIVKTSAPEPTRRAFTQNVKNDLRAGGSVVSDTRHVTFTITGYITDRPTVERGIRIVAELARYAVDWFEGYMRLPGAQWVHPSGSMDSRTPPTIRLVGAGPEVWVYPVIGEKAMTLCVAARLRRELPRFHFKLSEQGLDHEPPPGVFDAETLPMLAGVGRASLDHDDKWLRLTLHDELDERRVLAASKLVRGVSSGSLSVGAFR